MKTKGRGYYYKEHPFREKRTCEKCKKIYIAKMNNAKYCINCKGEKRTPFKHLSTGQVGAMTELMVCVDLIKRGYEVFRAVSPASSCDIAILKNNQLLRIEVKTGYRYLNGAIGSGYGENQKGRFDILAIVIHKTNEIIYQPNI
jgi:hypothetical protein